MAKIILDVKALSHNARQVGRLASDLGLTIIPILKALADHPAALATVAGEGFARFGFADLETLKANQIPRAQRTLIQLAPPSKAEKVLAVFGRSLQSSHQSLKQLNAIALNTGAFHEILLMINLGDQGSGLELGEVSETLDMVLKLDGLRFGGFAGMLSCASDRLPDIGLFEKLRNLISMSNSRGVKNPTICLGGTSMLNFVCRHGPGPITELRVGDPFVIGWDVYNHAELPRGPWRQDVCRLEGEVVELEARLMPEPKEQAELNAQAESNEHVEPNYEVSFNQETLGPEHSLLFDPGSAFIAQFKPAPSPKGRRLRVLLDLGRFHTGFGRLSGSDSRLLDQLSCLDPGAFIVGVTAGYTIVDVTKCPNTPKVGDKMSFRPGYWAIAQAFRHPGVEVAIHNGPEKKAERKEAKSSTSLMAFL